MAQCEPACIPGQGLCDRMGTCRCIGQYSGRDCGTEPDPRFMTAAIVLLSLHSVCLVAFTVRALMDRRLFRQQRQQWRIRRSVGQQAQWLAVLSLWLRVAYFAMSPVHNTVTADGNPAMFVMYHLIKWASLAVMIVMQVVISRFWYGLAANAVRLPSLKLPGAVLAVYMLALMLTTFLQAAAISEAEQSDLIVASSLLFAAGFATPAIMIVRASRPLLRRLREADSGKISGTSPSAKRHVKRVRDMRTMLIAMLVTLVIASVFAYAFDNEFASRFLFSNMYQLAVISAFFWYTRPSRASIEPASSQVTKSQTGILSPSATSRFNLARSPSTAGFTTSERPTMSSSSQHSAMRSGRIGPQRTQISGLLRSESFRYVRRSSRERTYATSSAADLEARQDVVDGDDAVPMPHPLAVEQQHTDSRVSFAAPRGAAQHAEKQQPDDPAVTESPATRASPPSPPRSVSPASSASASASASALCATSPHPDPEAAELPGAIPA